MIKVKYVDSIKGSSKENEDVVSFYNNYCWIIDGATDVFDTTTQNGFSVFTFVNEVSSELSLLCNDKKSLENIISQAISNVTLKYFSSFDFSEDYFAKLPTFSFIFCREIDNNFEYLMLGDCFLIIDGKIITDKRISEFSRKNRLKLEESMLKNKEINEKARLMIFRETRLKANKIGGYPIGSMNPNCVKSALKGRFSVVNIQRFVLMSDGYYNFYDPSKSLVENSMEISSNYRIDKLYGKKDDASVLEGIFI